MLPFIMADLKLTVVSLILATVATSLQALTTVAGALTGATAPPIQYVIYN